MQGRSFNALGSGIADNIVGRPVAVMRGATSSSLRRVVQDVGQLTSVSPHPDRAMRVARHCTVAEVSSVRTGSRFDCSSDITGQLWL